MIPGDYLFIFFLLLTSDDQRRKFVPFSSAHHIRISMRDHKIVNLKITFISVVKFYCSKSHLRIYFFLRFFFEQLLGFFYDAIFFFLSSFLFTNINDIFSLRNLFAFFGDLYCDIPKIHVADELTNVFLLISAPCNFIAAFSLPFRIRPRTTIINYERKFQEQRMFARSISLHSLSAIL